jgi:hypothetical protein
VMFATFVTLFLVPVLYYVGRDIRALTGRVAPNPEQQVEAS